MVDWEAGLAEYKAKKTDWESGLAEFKQRRIDSGQGKITDKSIDPMLIEKQQDPLTMGRAIYEGIGNLPRSAANQVLSVVDAIKNPKQTWEGLKELSKDIYKNQMETAVKNMGFEPSDLKVRVGDKYEDFGDTKALDAVIDDLEKTYGTYEGFKEAVASDPARILVDIGSIVAPTARVAGGVATGAKLPGAAKAAGVVAKGASLAEPTTAILSVAREGVGLTSKLVGKAFPKLQPSELFKSATKMSTVLSEGERTRLAQIALDQEVLPTYKGLDKIDSSISALDSKIANMIDSAEQAGNRIRISDLFNEFDDLKEAARLSGSGKEGIRAINRVKNSIIESNLEIGRNSLTPKQAQKLKQTIYKELDSYYDKATKSTATKDAKKAVARSAKQYLESIVPEIKMLNKADGDLIALRQAIERPVSRISNRDITAALGTFGKSGAGALIGSAVGGEKAAAALATVGLFAGIIDDPVVKSKLAVVLNKLQKKGANISPDNAIYKLAGIQVARTTQAGEEQ